MTEALVNRNLGKHKKKKKQRRPKDEDDEEKQQQTQKRFTFNPQKPPKRVNFYGERHLNGIFSNFAYYPVRVDGEHFATSEHYYQAQKFVHDGVKSKRRRLSVS